MSPALTVLDCANADHEASARALIRGLTSNERTNRKGCLIHTSGTGILMYKDTELLLTNKPVTLGGASPDMYDDWDGIDIVTSLPDSAPHRKVDKLVIEADNIDLKTAIVCPPTIYGVGRGPGNQRGHQVYELARCTLEKGHGIQVGAGKTFWPNVHVYDMSKCYLKLLALALSDSSVPAWGKQGYYFTENGEHVWGEIAKSVASKAVKQGFINTADVEAVSADEANQLTKVGALLWGANSRCRAVRARKLLGWEPHEQSLEKEISSVVESEGRKLGIVTGHAAKVAK